jgi:hypothetical protein
MSNCRKEISWLIGIRKGLQKGVMRVRGEMVPEREKGRARR